MSKKVKRQKNVLVAIIATGYTGWQKRAGVFRYIGEGHPWDVRLASTPDEFLDALRSGTVFDGIVFSAADRELVTRLPNGPRPPMVFFDINLPGDSPLFRRTTGTIFIHHDSKAIGETAAAHLLDDGRLHSFAYLDMAESVPWSDQRRLSFEKRLHAVGFPLLHLSVRTPRMSLTHALAELPRPIGLFAATDRLALQAYSLCHSAGLEIPADIAVLGVDDDPAICESVQPELSSVRTNPESIGYTAARLLDELMDSPQRRSRHVTLKCQTTVTRRASTSCGSPYGRLVEKAISYIAGHATEGIGPSDVANHLGVSRRILDLRFHQLTDSTVLRQIQSRRLEAVKRLLCESDESIEAITGKCGYGSVNHLKKIFKQSFGCSMRTWRLNQRKSSDQRDLTKKSARRRSLTSSPCG